MIEEDDSMRRYCTAVGEEIEDGFEHLPSAERHDFNKAKRCVVGTFKNIENLIAKLDVMFSEARTELKPMFEGYNNMKEWFSECRKFLEKEKMKAVIFGSTSSGKSTTVNAILHKTLLISGMGHVTNCIFQIEGSKDINKICVRKDNGKEEYIEDLEHYLERELSEELPKDCIVYITCPASQFQTFENDVMILDCPGLDKTTEHDSVIYNHCKDADVFVFVSDAKSTIRKTEVSFFEKIEDPTVFILFNCWDLTEKNERERKRAPKLRQQHLEDAHCFLKKSNKHVKEEDLADKIYFVSAEEFLETCETPKEKTEKQPGHQQREKEFTKFERAFWKYTTDSALHTRFGSRILNGKQRFKDLKKELKQLKVSLKKEEEKLRHAVDELTNRDKSVKEIIKSQQKERLTTILKLMEMERLQMYAKTYKKKMTMKNDKKTWNLFLQQLHEHLQNEIKKELHEILGKFQKNADENDRNEIESCLKDIKCSKETQNDIGCSQEQYEIDWKFDLPEEIDTDYTWSFAPYTLMKKYIRYRSYYQQQSTTSAGRAFLQIGGFGTAMTGCALAVASSFMLPVIGTSAALGTAFTYWHYNYDKSQWTEESKVEYLQEMCAANIHFQFESKYKAELLKTLEKLDEELLEYFNKRLANYKDDSKNMYQNIQRLNEEMEKSGYLKIISNGENELDAFERKYLRQDEFIGAQCVYYHPLM